MIEGAKVKPSFSEWFATQPIFEMTRFIEAVRATEHFEFGLRPSSPADIARSNGYDIFNVRESDFITSFGNYPKTLMVVRSVHDEDIEYTRDVNRISVEDLLHKTLMREEREGYPVVHVGVRDTQPEDWQKIVDIADLRDEKYDDVQWYAVLPTLAMQLRNVGEIVVELEGTYFWCDLSDRPLKENPHLQNVYANLLMNKAEEEFVFQTLEQLANYSYNLGFDQASAKQQRREPVVLKPMDKLQFRSQMALFVAQNHTHRSKKGVEWPAEKQKQNHE